MRGGGEWVGAYLRVPVGLEEGPELLGSLERDEEGLCGGDAPGAGEAVCERDAELGEGPPAALQERKGGVDREGRG